MTKKREWHSRFFYQPAAQARALRKCRMTKPECRNEHRIGRTSSFQRGAVDSNFVINECFEEVVEKIPIPRWERMRDCMTWTEFIDGEQCQFEVVLLENTPEYVHVSVSISYARATEDGTMLSPNVGNRSSSFVIKK